MTCIEKLSIQGIRSFDVNTASCIEFEKPLTLIVGPNGAGKTTVIECLKYATTGELPPDSSKGQAFVHDPRLVQEKEVKAQVKLLFSTVNGKPIVCTRSLQLTQKPNTQTIKTLDSVLVTKNAEGKQISQSMKCADIDKEIPELMGVSKAILTNVIFCHQEESNWPLEESTSIKKRFDAIFASTRYTKALEVIHSQKKDLNLRIRENKLQLQLEQSRLDTAKSIRKEVVDNQEKLDNFEKEVQDISRIIESQEREYNILNAAKEKSISEMNELTRLRQMKVQITKDLKSYQGDIVTESIDELESQLKNFNSDTESIKNQKEEYERMRRSILENKKKEENEAQLISIKIGQVQASQKHLKELIEERDKTILAFVGSYMKKMNDFKDVSLPLSQEMNDLFFKKVKLLLDAITNKLKVFAEKHKADEESHEKELEKITMECLTLKSMIEESQRNERNSKREIEQINKEVEKKQKLYSQLETMQKELDEKKGKLERLNKDFNKDEIENKSVLLKKQKSTLGEDINKLRQEGVKLTTYAQQTSKLNLLKNLIEEKESLIRNKKNENAELLASIFGNNIEQLSTRDMIDTISTLNNEFQIGIESERRKLTETNKQYNFIEGSYANVKESAKKRKENVNLIKINFEKLKLNQNIGDAVKTTDRKIAEYQEEITRRKSAQILYQKFIELARASHECPLCQHHISDEEKFVSKLKLDLEEVPKDIELNQSKLEQAEKAREKLRKYQPDWETVKKEEIEIPLLDKQIEEYQTKMETLSSDSKKIELDLNSLVEREKSGKKISEIMNSIKNLEDEKEKVMREYSVIEGKLPKDFVSSSSRSAQEVNDDIEKIEKQIKKIDLEITGNYTHISKSATDITNLTLAIGESEKEINSMRSFHTDIDNLNIKCSNLNSIIEKEIEKVSQLTPKYNELLLQQEEQKKKIRNFKISFEVDNNTFVAEKEKFLERQNIITNQQTTITRIMNDSNNNLDFESIEKSKNEITLKLNKIKNDLASIEEMISSLSEKISQGDMRKLSIKEKLRYKNLEISLNDTENRIDTLKEKLEGIGMNVDIDHKLKSIQGDLIQARSKRDISQGSASTHKQMIKSKDVELKNKFTDVDKIYKNQLIVVKTNEMAYIDLEKYYNALDKALMKYHTLKMTEINAVLKELWQATYKGQDIESIEIRAESETANKRSFNYRVVMIKDSVAVDMRGRCSAGQKVLASLIIRLALAETFCASCGILALDEPTTNLDRMNVESFANALVEIIENRKKSRSFQLIIITHDEEFVQTIGRSDHAEHYYRVTKQENDKRQLHSTIQRYKIKSIELG